MESMPKGKVQTVCGPVEPDSIGVTLAHEHLCHEANASMFEPREPMDKHAHLSDSKFKAENLWWINFHPYSHKDNLVFEDETTLTAVGEEMQFFKDNGGGTIVEATTFGKDVNYLKIISQKTGVNIVAGAGYYVNAAQGPEQLSLSVEEMAADIRADLLVGLNGIRCGIIGEIGTCYPIHPFEKRSLEAAAIVQRELGVPVNIHPGRDSRAPDEVMRIFLEAGGQADRTVMSHLERTLLLDEELLEFAKLGCFCEFDLFGIETSYYELSDSFSMPSDAVRIDRLKTMIGEGHGSKLLIAHDIHTKHRLMKFGGHGYSHILLNTVPCMRRSGFTQLEIDDILVNNPKRMLTL